MIIQEFEFELKDGRKALVRSPKEEDVQGMLEYLKMAAGETEYLLRYPDEWDLVNEEEEKNWFDRMNRSDSEVMLVCLIDGKIAGNCTLSWRPLRKLNHRASIGVALKKEYWGLGIGTRLLSELIRIAEKHENLLQIELEFVEGNSRARALYEKMGFRISGIRPDAICLQDGTFLNEYSMVRMINRSSGHRDFDKEINHGI